MHVRSAGGQRGLVPPLLGDNEPCQRGFELNTSMHPAGKEFFLFDLLTYLVGGC
jgi:hypothetical protein